MKSFLELSFIIGVCNVVNWITKSDVGVYFAIGYLFSKINHEK